MSNGWTLGSRLARTKPLSHFSVNDGHGHSSGSGLKRSITLYQLTALGVGATIGTGIFFVMSETVPLAGPGVLISFILAGGVAGLTALCYAEMASMLPVSGSSYSYAYAVLGEGPAFLVASCLVLEYGIASSAVAIGWGSYVSKFIELVFGGALPAALTHGPIVMTQGGGLAFGGDGMINLPATILVILVCMLLMRGTIESAKANAIMVAIKIIVLAMFIVIAFTGFQAEHLTPFMPHGMGGVSAAAGMVFFSYVGLDAICTAGEEVENPKRNLPLAILVALIIVISIYMLVALSALGAQPTEARRNSKGGVTQDEAGKCSG